MAPGAPHPTSPALGRKWRAGRLGARWFDTSTARSACALAVAAAIVQPCAAQDSSSDPAAPKNANAYFLGSVLPGRNVPPLQGCTVVGKVYWPITPDMFVKPYTIQHGWDWCQHKCENMWVSEMDGTPGPCTHFAFYPDGKCFLQGKNVTLVDAPECNMTSPCEHGFPVVSGPRTCDDTELEAVPPTDPTPAPTTTTTSPKLAGEGEQCTPSLPPPYNVLCEDGLNCNTNGLLGAPGTCSSKVGLGGECDTSTKLCLDALQCISPPDGPPGAPGLCQAVDADAGEGDSSVAIVAPPVVVTSPSSTTTLADNAFCSNSCEFARDSSCDDGGHGSADNFCDFGTDCADCGIRTLTVTTSTSTVTTTTATFTTVTTTSSTSTEPPPAKATITGWYYTPLGNQLWALGGWRGCMSLCQADVFCQHWGYYPHNNGCRTTGKDVLLQKATCENNETDCAELGVISGPRDLTDEALWPKIPVPPTVKAEEGEEGQKRAGGAGFGLLVIVLVLALLGVLGAGYYGYNNGWFGGGGRDSDDDVQSGSESDVEKPFSGS